MSENIIKNDAAMAILASAKMQLEAIGVHCSLAPMSLQQGMTVSLHVATSNYLVTAAYIASGIGGKHANASDTHEEFAGEVASALADAAIDSASHTAI